MNAAHYTRMAAAVLLGGLLSANAWADTVQKLGFINTERVYQESKQAQAIQQTLLQEFADRQKQLDKMQQEGLALEQKLATLKPGAERNRLLEELGKLSHRFRTEQVRFSEEYSLRRNEEFAALQQKATQVIVDLAKKEGYDLILQDVVFVDGKFDITDKVILEMNR